MPDIQEGEHREASPDNGPKLNDFLFDKGFELQETVDGALDTAGATLVQDTGAHNPELKWEPHDVELRRDYHFRTQGYDIKVDQGYDGSEKKHGYVTLEIKKEGSQDVLTLEVVNIGNRSSLVEGEGEAQVIVKMALNGEPVAEFDSDRFDKEPLAETLKLGDEASLKQLGEKVKWCIGLLKQWRQDLHYGEE